MDYLLLNVPVAKESRETMTAYKVLLYKFLWIIYQILFFAVIRTSLSGIKEVLQVLDREFNISLPEGLPAQYYD